MKKKVLIGLIVAVLVVLGFILSKNKTVAPTTQDVASTTTTTTTQQPQTQAAADQSSVQDQSQTQSQNNNSNNQSSMGLEIKTTQEGTGAAVKAGDTVSVLYTGKLQDGTVFDASSKHGNTPFSFQVGAGMVIKGWDQGLLGAKVGEKRTLTIPGDLAYGPNGIPGVIPPNATLIFDIEVLSIK